MEKIDSKYDIKTNLSIFHQEEINTEDITKIDTNKFKTLKIINSLFFDSNNIDLFSTNELERIIVYSNFDKKKTLDLIESKSKDEIFKLIEENEKNSNFINNTSVKKDVGKKYKSVYLIDYKNINLSSLDSDLAWNFLYKTQNIIDLQDVLITYNQHKLINNVFKKVKDKDCKKMVDYFEKFEKERERKYKEIFKGNLEDNDLIYLQTEEYVLDYKLPVKIDLSQKINDYSNFSELFEKLNSDLKSYIMNFLDIQSVGKFSICNKSFYQFISKKYNYEKLAKFYCLLIFKNTNIYVNEEKDLKIYRNYFEMFRKRPRVFYSGIYYSKIKYTQLGEIYGAPGSVLNTLFNFRFYRFFPNGEVYSFTCPSFKPRKILSMMQSNSAMIRKGSYIIDKDNYLTIETVCGITIYSYRYKLIKLKGPSFIDYNGIELIECYMKNWNDVIKIDVNDKFPRLFKFRSFNLLKNELIIKKKICEE